MATGRRNLAAAPVWAGIGTIAGMLTLVSPWLGAAASVAWVAAALWRGRRTVPASVKPVAGDLAGPWPEPGIEALRADLAGIWTRARAASEALHTTIAQLDRRMTDWATLTGHGGSNLDTLARSLHAQGGALDSAIQALANHLRERAEVQQQWLQAISGLTTASARLDRLQDALSAGRDEWERVRLLGDALGQTLAAARPALALRLTLPAGGPELVATARRLADEAGRLGKPGWGAALHATELADSLQAWILQIEAVFAPLEQQQAALPAVLSGAERLAASCRLAELPVPAPGDALPVLGPLPEQDWQAVISRLNSVDRETRLSAGLAEGLTETMAGLQGRAKRLADDLATIRHLAGELLILAGYVRTDPAMPPCHLNRTAWCFTDGVCERCPLTQLSEDEYPGLLGAAMTQERPVPKKTGRTIDLE